MNSLLDAIVHYGYAGLFFTMVLGVLAIPLPIETMLVGAGVLAGRGKLNLVFAGFSALGGTVAGVSLSYLLGLTIGASLLARYGKYVRLTPQYVERAHDWFHRSGEWVLVFGYFVTGIRHLSGLLAGMTRLEYRTFALFAYAGAIIWVSLFLGVGYELGDRWESAMHFIHRYTYLALLIGAIALGTAYLIKRRFRRSQNIP